MDVPKYHNEDMAPLIVGMSFDLRFLPLLHDKNLRTTITGAGTYFLGTTKFASAQPVTGPETPLAISVSMLPKIYGVDLNFEEPNTEVPIVIYARPWRHWKDGEAIPSQTSVPLFQIRRNPKLDCVDLFVTREGHERASFFA